MNAYLHRNEERGHVQIDWLDSKHSFSFGQWYNPKYMGVSVLRVINDDTIAAHRGFGTHPHDNMEILTCVLEGSLTHKDSMGNEGQIKAGEWQLMSAGTGIQHSEINHGDIPVHLLQIWIHPDVKNAEPSYQQIQLDPHHQPNQWHVIAGPNDNAAMHIRQQTEVKTAVLQDHQHLDVASQFGLNYIHVIRGVIEIGDYIIRAGDALVLSDVTSIYALEESQLIWFDLPAR
ncbi:MULTISPECIES: pirin family protein [unclassified Acinetobacter]|uniref:pirin family protein n=1 Tax=unclassified Acinetobacter TaxID=196816 RepID=UPI0029347149|nr:MULTISPECIES: pirin family protein [unclassified Acinetobacter]WOE32712.1 pirin family protein [Acinetobacter sp. SAAs470]WOE38188.1 pirin family protein [Acinetobacter sp. SAAs474]